MPPRGEVAGDAVSIGRARCVAEDPGGGDANTAHRVGGGSARYATCEGSMRFDEIRRRHGQPESRDIRKADAPGSLDEAVVAEECEGETPLHLHHPHHPPRHPCPYRTRCSNRDLDQNKTLSRTECSSDICHIGRVSRSWRRGSNRAGSLKCGANRWRHAVGIRRPHVDGPAGCLLGRVQSLGGFLRVADELAALLCGATGRRGVRRGSAAEPGDVARAPGGGDVRGRGGGGRRWRHGRWRRWRRWGRK